jgi:uncharacterized membrane protein YczE
MTWKNVPLNSTTLLESGIQSANLMLIAIGIMLMQSIFPVKLYWPTWIQGPSVLAQLTAFLISVSIGHCRYKILHDTLAQAYGLRVGEWSQSITAAIVTTRSWSECAISGLN